MSLSQKLELLSGNRLFGICGIEQFNIKPIKLADGPNGVRHVSECNGKLVTDKATVFPSLIALAATFNEELVSNVGSAIANECIYYDVDILLAPGVNIIKTPLCGRTFEYFSEDPFLSGQMGGSYIQGVQKMGVAATIKHFACNNTEINRLVLDSIVDDKTLHNTYLKSFEIAIKKSNPMFLMTAYNKVNGVYCTENSYLQRDILKQWNYHGITMSDWGACYDRTLSLKANLDIAMPYNECYFNQLLTAYNKNEITDEIIDAHVYKICKAIVELKSKSRLKNLNIFEENKGIAYQASLESLILLDNEDKILPLDANKLKKVSIIGEYAKEMHIQGEGSAKVNPMYTTNAYEYIISHLNKDTIVQYFDLKPCEDMALTTMYWDIYNKSSDSDVIFYFLGTKKIDESEMFDRNDLYIDPHFYQVLNLLLEYNKKVILITSCGSAVTMPNLCKKPKTHLLSLFGGSMSGKAIADVLFGKANPSGRLPITFPKDKTQISCYKDYPPVFEFQYNDLVNVGYKHFEINNLDPLYCFGHGYSYSQFQYSDLTITREKESLLINFTLRNLSEFDGKNTCLIFASYNNNPKELKGFVKKEIEKFNEEKISTRISFESLKSYNTLTKKYELPQGFYEIYVGNSVCDLSLSQKIMIDLSDK